jgi:uncharacterized membrane protein
MPVSQVTLHPATVHFPIALLLVGSVAALLYLYTSPRQTLCIMAWGSLLVGWATGGLAILTGLLAQSGLPPQAPYSAVLNGHIGTGLAIMLVYGTLLYRAWLVRNRARPGKPANLLDVPSARGWVTALLLLGMATVTITGWLGGELVYQWGVNVNRPGL